MLECSSCGKILGDELRPKFFMVLEQENIDSPNIKRIYCSHCGSLNYALNTEFCQKCKYSWAAIRDKQGKILSVGCRGQCLAFLTLKKF